MAGRSTFSQQPKKMQGHVYQPISSSSSEETGTEEMYVFQDAGKASFRRWLFLTVFVGALFVANICLWINLMVSSPAATSSTSALGPSYYDATPTLRQFHWTTDFQSENKTISNALWRDMFPAGEGLVSVSKEFAAEKGYPASLQDPADASHSMYLTAGFHQLHCLTVLRAAIFHYQEGVNQTVPWPHITHCLDSIRQALMCKVDTTLLYSEDGNVWGKDQEHVCGDWDGFENWVKGNAKIA